MPAASPEFTQPHSLEKMRVDEMETALKCEAVILELNQRLRTLQLGKDLADQESGLHQTLLQIISYLPQMPSLMLTVFPVQPHIGTLQPFIEGYRSHYPRNRAAWRIKIPSLNGLSLHQDEIGLALTAQFLITAINAKQMLKLPANPYQGLPPSLALLPRLIAKPSLSRSPTNSAPLPDPHRQEPE